MVFPSSSQYSGKTVEHVLTVNPSYVAYGYGKYSRTRDYIKQNCMDLARTEMAKWLKSHKPKPEHMMMVNDLGLGEDKQDTRLDTLLELVKTIEQRTKPKPKVRYSFTAKAHKELQDCLVPLMNSLHLDQKKAMETYDLVVKSAEVHENTNVIILGLQK